MADERKSSRREIGRLTRVLDGKKDALIACFELAEKFRQDISRIEGELRAQQSK